jgi:ubiquinone/menaquinone biosynthesis C-methylase UbiE
MPKTEPFDNYHSAYEDWFVENKYVYQSELQAIKELLPKDKNGIEIGVGSGLFAEPLGIKAGIDPSSQMAKIAKHRGINVINGIAEKLPIEDETYEFALMVTTICFLDDINASFKEVKRILKPDGIFIIGFVDKQSQIGKSYQKYKNESLFYKIATFYSVAEVIDHLKIAGFKNYKFKQTIFQKLSDVKNIEPVKQGYGEGSFVVVSSSK